MVQIHVLASAVATTTTTIPANAPLIRHQSTPSQANLPSLERRYESEAIRCSPEEVMVQTKILVGRATSSEVSKPATETSAFVSGLGRIGAFTRDIWDEAFGGMGIGLLEQVLDERGQRKRCRLTGYGVVLPTRDLGGTLEIISSAVCRPNTRTTGQVRCICSLLVLRGVPRCEPGFEA